MNIYEVNILIDKAHNIFNASSIYDVIDLENRQEAEVFLKRKYDNPDTTSINIYLDLVETIRKYLSSDSECAQQ